MAANKVDIVSENYKERYGFSDPVDGYAVKGIKGLSERVVQEISRLHDEPAWMEEIRMKALRHFLDRAPPSWAPELADIDYQSFYYYASPTKKAADSWDQLPAYIRNTYDKLGIPEAEKKFLAGVGAIYECLSGDVRVFTTRGLVPISEVNADDIAFSWDEKTDQIIPAPVKDKSHKGRRQVFRVKTETDSILATKSHPFLVLRHVLPMGHKRRGYWLKEWRYLFEIRVGDLVVIPKEIPLIGKPHAMVEPEVYTTTVGHNQFGAAYVLDISNRYNPIGLPHNSTAELMWFLGLYVGDGLIHSSVRESGRARARVEFLVTTKEPRLRDELISVGRRVFGLEPTLTDDLVTFNSTVLANFMTANGFHTGARAKSIPEWVFALPRAQILGFLAGIIDSDGYVHPSNYASITSCNKKLIDQLRDLCKLCGFPVSKISPFRGRNRDGETKNYRFHIHGRFEEMPCRNSQRTSRFWKRKYIHTREGTKKANLHKYLGDHVGVARVISIESAGSEDVYDIEINGPHNFVAEGFIVHNSEAVYHSIQGELAKQGVVFTDTVTALKEYPEIMKKYFGTVVPYQDNYIAALQTAVWSAGSFVHVPEGVKVGMPLQAYFRINEKNMGQFERTLIVGEPYSEVNYSEGCTAPVYSSQSLHSAIVEIVAKKGSLVKYTTLQNWSRDVLNLVTKRAHAYEEATVSWVDFNGGSRLTRKYPSIYLLGPRAKADIISVAYAGEGQVQDTGGKAIHLAKDTTSKIISRSVSKDGGHTAYRGLLHIAKGAKSVKSSVRCVKPDTIVLGDNKPIAEYEIGDQVIGASGESTVNRTYANEFEGEMIRIKALGLLPIEVTPEHPMLVARSRITYPCVTRNGRHSHTMKIALGSSSWKPASLLMAKRSSVDGDYVLIPRLQGNIDTRELDLSSFAKNTRGLKIMARKGHTPSLPLNSDTAWILGLYVAEGYSSQGKLKFALNSSETALKDRIVRVFEALGYKVNTYKRKDENGIETIVFGDVLSRAFESWCGKGAPQKRIPDFVLLHKNPGIVDSFFDGYVSGDGTTTLNCMGNRNVIHIVTTSRLLAMQIQLLGARKGLFFRISRASKAEVVQGRNVKVHQKYDVRCNTSDGNQTRIDDKFVYAPIRRIERVKYSGPVHNLETSDHTYLISNAVSHNCDALLIDERSTTATYPYMEIQEDDATVTHEASVGKVGEEQLFYLMSRGMSDSDALSMVVNGFLEPFTRELPMAYAVEFNRLMSLEMTNTVG